jgi:hypothetical protein
VVEVYGNLPIIVIVKREREKRHLYVEIALAFECLLSCLCASSYTLEVATV